ncbi:DUF3916 domain-containing protein [Streptococcus caprae]|uniref:DUF3916 domain-containing protein n=1 Tax=Streptococcus caprae TaxID=1640501 RepID=A0ABV8CST0_9STRE
MSQIIVFFDEDYYQTFFDRGDTDQTWCWLAGGLSPVLTETSLSVSTLIETCQSEGRTYHARLYVVASP